MACETETIGFNVLSSVDYLSRYVLKQGVSNELGGLKFQFAVENLDTEACPSSCLFLFVLYFEALFGF